MQLRGHRCRVVAGRRVQAGRRGRRGGLGGLEDQGLEVDPFLEAAADLQVELVKYDFVHVFCRDSNLIQGAVVD